MKEFFSNPAVWFVLIVLMFGLLALIIFLIRKFFINKKEEKPEIDEAQIAEERLNNILETVEDDKDLDQFEESSKQVEEDVK
jgi:flagellar biosynthesis/type III secretory pathway M-ring protein FliF/YscJ